jgi:hypothetical protein
MNCIVPCLPLFPRKIEIPDYFYLALYVYLLMKPKGGMHVGLRLSLLVRPTANDQYCEVPAPELQAGFRFTASENH